MSAEWYDLGIQLNVRPDALDAIRAEFSAPKHCLREMLKAWLITGDNPSWESLVVALRSKVVAEHRLAACVEKKYSLVEKTEGMSFHAQQPC